MYQLVVVWYDGNKDVYDYRTREQAEEAGRGMKVALGNQIAWYGTRERRAI